MCKETGLSNQDLEDMTVNMALDYIEEYIDRKSPKKNNVRAAAQDDFDKF